MLLFLFTHNPAGGSLKGSIQKTHDIFFFFFFLQCTDTQNLGKSANASLWVI